MPSSRAQQLQELNDIRSEILTLHFYTTNPTSQDTGTEVSGGGYVAQTVTFAVPAVVGNGTEMTNDAVITFPTATGDWSSASPVTHFAVRTPARMVHYGELTSLSVPVGRVVRSGDVFQLGVGVVKIRKPD